VSLDESVLTVGASTVAGVKFTFSSDDVFDDDRNVVVSVRLPDELAYRIGTAEIKQPIDDREVEPAIETCGDGTSFLIFDLDEDDLAAAENPDGDADAELRFTVDAVAIGTGDSVLASAHNDAIIAGCDAPFIGERAAAVTVS
jgi:hypothetical protein